MPTWRVMLAATLLSAAVACDETDDGKVACELGTEQVLDSIDSGVFDDVAMVVVDGLPAIVWSQERGLFFARLDAEGAPRGEIRRLSRRCRGGVAAAASGPSVLVACLMQPDERTDKPGAVLLLRLAPDGSVRSRTLLGSASIDSFGVATVEGPDGPVVAWRDGSRVWVDEVVGDVDRGPTMVSSPTVGAGVPFLDRDGDRVLVLWAETWVEGGVDTGQVVIQIGHAAPTTLMEVLYGEPTPMVARDEHGLLLGVRDRRRPYPKAGLYLTRLDDDLRPVGEGIRAGRADGPGRPALLPCGGQWVTAAPRTWSHDILVGVNVLSPDFDSLVNERHFYEYGHEFVRTAAVCIDRQPVVVALERGNSYRPQAKLRVVPFHCE